MTTQTLCPVVGLPVNVTIYFERSLRLRRVLTHHGRTNRRPTYNGLYMLPLLKTGKAKALECD